MSNKHIRHASGFGRHKVIQAGLCVLGALFLPGAVLAQTQADDTIVVTLLGTGSPSPNPDRFSSATLVQAGGCCSMRGAAPPSVYAKSM